MFGWSLRWKVITSKAMRKRFEAERKEFGLEKPETFKQFLSRYTQEQQVQAAVEDQARLATERQRSMEVEEVEASSDQPEDIPNRNLNPA